MLEINYTLSHVINLQSLKNMKPVCNNFSIILNSQSNQVMVKMLAQDGSDNHWLWERNKFINRKFMMQEMYQNYVEGDANWDVPQVCVLNSVSS